MLKSIRVLIILLTIVWFLSVAPKGLAGPVAYDEAYLAVVKIYTYYEDENYYLSAAKVGSGVLIDSKGTILTNEHVVTVKDAFDKELPVAFRICLTEDPDKEPICSFSAGLIAKDEKKDVALLKIKDIGLNANKNLNKGFYHLFTDTSGKFSNGQGVLSLGYPSAGGEAITISGGTILGKTEKYGLSWIKTDAFVSFGSSGGALINGNSNVIGITSAINSDIGYVIDLSSIKDWLRDHADGLGQTSPLLEKLTKLMIKQNNLKVFTKFTNDLPYVELAKPKGWEFKFIDEDSVSLYDNQINDGGVVSINWGQSEAVIDEKYLDTLIKTLDVQNSCFSSGTVTLAKKTGRKVICPISGEEVQEVIFSSGNYYIIVSYYYGKDKIDQSTVDQILKDLALADRQYDFVEQKSYQHKEPYFKISMPDPWSLRARNDASEPVRGINKINPEADFTIYIGKITDSQKTMSNQSYFNYIRDADVIKSQTESVFKFKGTRYFDSVDYKINNELAHEIFYKYRFKDENDGDKVKLYAAGFRIRNNDRVIIIELSYLGGDDKLFEQYLKEFQDKVLVNLTLGRSTQKNSDIINKIESKTDQIVQKTMLQSAVEQVQAIKNVGKRFIGRILLRVQNNGEAWYLSPKTNQAHYLANGEAAYQLMREQGIGITNKDLTQIPVGLSNLSGDDADHDGLTDALELALGTDKDKADSDDDGFNDKDEIQNGFNPLQKGNYSYNKALSNRLKGKILLQVESHGEAWYVNPKDGKRYFLSTAKDAYQVMKEQSMGISEKDFAKL